MASASVVPPPWLQDALPAWSWTSLRRCQLRVDAEHGAGLDLEASELGYLVDGVDQLPGQAKELQPGSAVLGIGGARLLGLEEEAQERAFGAEFHDGAEVLLADAEEVRRALARDDSGGMMVDGGSETDAMADVVQEHGSVLRVPLACTDARDTQAFNRDGFLSDLATFSERTGVRAELHDADAERAGSRPCVVLAGVPEDVRAARPELGQLLRFYNVDASRARESSGAAPMEVEAAETLEVEGMVLQSLPARGRRRRHAPGDGETVVEDAQSTAAAASNGSGAAAVQRGKPPPSLETPVAASASTGAPGERRQFEFLDHTADVILHSWGRTFEEALEQVCVCFFSYMTDLDTVELRASTEVEATGHDILDMLYHLLDEFLFAFGTDFVVCRQVEILELDLAKLKVRARGRGERFDLSRHPQGTEIKAITMHQMKILSPDTLTSEEGTVPRKQSGMEGGAAREGFPYECYVLVDI